ncbi:MAG: MFS transporter [Pseudomonadales bacterium]
MKTSLSARHAERRYELDVQRNLTRNFLVHLCHGMFGQTGFRLLQAPTFLPAYVLLLSNGSDFAVGAALAVQSIGMTLTPLIGANLIEHRKRVLPIGMWSGIAMRLAVLGIALAGFLLPPKWALLAVYFGLLCFGLFQGMQGVIFNFLMSKVIPVSKRGRLTGLRNFLAGITAAVVAYAAGIWFLGATPTIAGYSQTFLLAFVLTSIGLASLLLLREPQPPTVKSQQTLRGRLAEVPELLRLDPAFRRYVIARSLATLGRMSLPFYVVYAGTNMALTGPRLAALTIGFSLAATLSNLVWGALGDRRGFRAVLLISILLWILATALLPLGHEQFWLSVVVFVGVGAATQGFAASAQNLTLEFGRREDLPVRIAIANSASELSGAIGPLLGGLIAATLGYGALFGTAMFFLLLGGALIALFVPEPRFAPEGG